MISYAFDFLLGHEGIFLSIILGLCRSKCVFLFHNLLNLERTFILHVLCHGILIAI